MLAGSTGCGEVDNDFSVTVESSEVSHVLFVVRDDIDVVVFCPAYSFKMDRYGRANRSRHRSHADNTRFDDKVSERDCLLTVAQRESVQPAHIVGNDNGKFDFAVASCTNFGDHPLSRLESVATHAAPFESLPHQLERANPAETLTAQHSARPNRALGRTES